jgi:hypothetical protein
MCRSYEDQREQVSWSKAVAAAIQTKKARFMAVAKIIKTPQARALCGVGR